MTSKRLFCLPYAGVDAAAFQSWKADLPREVEIAEVAVPGRGKQSKKSAITRMPELVKAVLADVRKRLDFPFAIFGHGSGALIAFELTRALRREKLPLPMRLFVSGHRAPHLPSSVDNIHELDEPAFRDALRQRQNVPDEVLGHEELMDVVSPILRAEYELWETYEFTPEDRLTMPIDVFVGISDATLEQSELNPWREHSSAPVKVRMFPGGHLYLQSERKRLITEIARGMETL